MSRISVWNSTGGNRSERRITSSSGAHVYLLDSLVGVGRLPYRRRRRYPFVIASSCTDIKWENARETRRRFRMSSRRQRLKISRMSSIGRVSQHEYVGIGFRGTISSCLLGALRAIKTSMCQLSAMNQDEKNSKSCWKEELVLQRSKLMLMNSAVLLQP